MTNDQSPISNVKQGFVVSLNATHPTQTEVCGITANIANCRLSIADLKAF
jgi:hypothetical protein